jgi:hypothetical protein
MVKHHAEVNQRKAQMAPARKAIEINHFEQPGAMVNC